MATHSSVLAWRIPGMGEPGGLPSMGSQSRTRLKRVSSSSSSSIQLYWVLVTVPGIKLLSPELKARFLATGPPGNSSVCCLLNHLCT